MKFKIYKYADVSTGEIEESDLPLLTTQSPLCFADYPDGAFFYVPVGDAAEVRDRLASAREFGFSKKLINIMREAHRQGIPYVRFDADGAEIQQSRNKPK